MINKRTILLLLWMLLISSRKSYVVVVTGWTTVPIVSIPTPTSLPILGIGSIVFPVRDAVIEYTSQYDTSYNKRAALTEASDFFVDAFWTGKVGGGATKLTTTQRRNLEQSQTAEFMKRYGSSGKLLSSSSNYNYSSRSEFIICRKNRNINGDIIGCVGVEVERIPDGSLRGPIGTTRAPLMSNLAISRQYRRRGLAEKLVRTVEDVVRKEWGYNECYLYVEGRNVGAIKLYQKLGYRTIWKDSSATTLLPTSDGSLQSTSTVLLCMKKDLSNGNLFSRFFFPFGN